jgi:UPF0755 protein
VRVKFDSPISRIVSALLIAFLLTLTLREIRGLGNSAPDFPCSQSSTEEVTIEVKSGESGSSIARQLFSKGVTESSEAFFRVAVSDPRAAQIAPGAHRLNTEICAKEALIQLLDSKRLVGLINIVEGAWISEVIPQMYKAGFQTQDVTEALRSVEKPQGFTSLEGLLFPAQYSFAQGTSAQSAISSMVKNSERAMQDAGFFSQESKYSPQQLLVIASLLQAEGKSQDFRKISQVIQNRLRIGMPLQFDSTVHYVKKVRGNIFLSAQSTLISSPYNTYRKYGLPPGPINNPGLEAMRAAMNPKAGNWIYFITVAPSDTRFTDDLDQFNTWKVEYKKNLRAGLFGSSR